MISSLTIESMAFAGFVQCLTLALTFSYYPRAHSSNDVYYTKTSALQFSSLYRLYRSDNEVPNRYITVRLT